MALSHPKIRMVLTAHDEAPAPALFVEPPAPALVQPETKPAEEKPKPKAPEVAEGAEGGDAIPAKHVPVGELAAEREKRKAAAAELATTKTALAAAERKIQEADDAKKSDLELAQATAERAVQRERSANLRAVATELKSAAIAADAEDAGIVVDLLNRDPDRYLTDSGIDEDAIAKAVADLLEAKPILRKKVAPPTDAKPAREKPAPIPDPSQGARGGTTPVDFRTASAEEYAAELAKHNLRPR